MVVNLVEWFCDPSCMTPAHLKVTGLRNANVQDLNLCIFSNHYRPIVADNI